MAKILGIDYGRKKIGLAVADIESRLAEPLGVLRYKDDLVLMEEIKKTVGGQSIGKIVIGVSEGEMGKESKEFGKLLEKDLNIPVAFQDETLTTYEAQKKSISAGMKRKKRNEMEDAFAAAIILQSFLDKLRL